MADPNPDNGTLRSFGQFLSAVQEGDLHGDLSGELQDVVATLNEIRATDGGTPKARITLTFDLALDKHGLVEVTADYAVKTPKAARSKTTFWTTADNNLTRRNPRQMELGLRDATPGRAADDIRTA